MFGVEYLHLQLDDGSDLYVTDHGLPFTRLSVPNNPSSLILRNLRSLPKIRFFVDVVVPVRALSADSPSVAASQR